MSLKFRKRIRVFPGFTLNLSKSGMSAILGVRGCSVNIGRHGTSLNTGISGTGLYDRKKIDYPNNSIIPEQNQEIPNNNYILETEIKSYNPELLTSDSMVALKKSILDAKKVKKEMFEEWQQANSSKNSTLFFLIILHFIIIGFFLKGLKQEYREKKLFAEDLKKDYENFSLELDFNFDKETLNDYITIRKYFDEMSKSNKIWDITSYRETDRYHERTVATKIITRQPVQFYHQALDFIKTSYDAMVLGNANGGNLYIYPGFVIVKESSSTDFGIIDLKNISFIYSDSSFIEEETVPSDSKNLGYTWKYCNKNGSPDRRYSNNYQIPIQQYGEIAISSSEGLNEEFMISNSDATNLFTTNLYNFIALLNKMNWNAQMIEDKA